ncbi:MAG: PilN domain-containing protein [Elusimicrobia bacterium]|nr:PilN domain-containing protein [Elusimicrobiota bacterium]
MTKINLIPKESIIKEEHPELKILAIGAASLLVLGITYTYVAKVTKRAAIKKEIRIVDNELKKLQKTIDKISALKSQKDALNAKKTALEILIKTRLVYPMMMEDLAKILPKGLWLLNLNTTSKENITALNFNAIAYNNYIIADMLQAFEDSKLFRNPGIGAITTSVNADGDEVRQFPITVDYINQDWK